MPRSGALCRLVALSVLLWAPSCAGQDEGYRTVSMTVTYDAPDRGSREWRAFLKALDECHSGGFADAQAAGPPERRCLENGADGCRRTEARLSWDCVGMGYQPN